MTLLEETLSIYKPPYYISEGDFQVCAQDNPEHGLVMAWDWIDNSITGHRYKLNDLKKNIVRKVNGEDVKLEIPLAAEGVKLGLMFNTGKSSITIYSGETAIMCIRGWGMLTGYPYRKDPKEAELIQNAFRDYIIEMLNK